MTDRTISIGIDLGTTNSSVAVNNNSTIEIVKKPGGLEYTPSVFGFDKAKNKVVGTKAYEALHSDATGTGTRNFKPEVKRIIGTPEKFLFERAGVEMSAEEISAEILKSLLQDVTRKYPHFDTTSAVITIPAAFSTLQCEATKRAGNLAGLRYVVLLQEPIAAAVSYGFGANANENWLIYDLGGGTFDVALVSSTDGVLTVLGHNGDNFLGGKNFDWEIVDKILAPEVQASFGLRDFSRDNPIHQTKFSKLKFIAERAKIELSQYEMASVDIDGIGDDDNGVPISLSAEISRYQLESLIAPLVDRTIALCQKTLQESGLASTSVTKIILVGAPTQIPYISHRLEEVLQVPTDASVDPLTVVARGACIFGLSQRWEDADPSLEPLPPGVHKLALNYEALTAEPDQTVSGKIEGLPTGQFSILIQSEDGAFSTPQIPLKNGRFFTSVALQKNRSNLFWIYLLDGQQSSLDISPDSFTITHGLSIAGAPLPHSIGVAVQKRSHDTSSSTTEVFERLLEKGTILPAAKTETYKTVRALKKAEGDNRLWIRVGEGESEVPDRNTFVCELGIKGSDLPKDLPQGTEVELTVEVNDIRELSVTAYIPSIDLRLNARSTFVDERLNIDDLRTDLDKQMERAGSLSASCSNDQRDRISTAYSSASSSLQNAKIDEDEKRKAAKQVRDLKQLLDETERKTEFSQLSADFTRGTTEVAGIIAEIKDTAEQTKHSNVLTEIKNEGTRAISNNDKKLLTGINERLIDLGRRALFSLPETWVHNFRYMVAEDRWTSKTEANYFIAQGERAINNNDIEALKRACQSLYALIPSSSGPPSAALTSGITR